MTSSTDEATRLARRLERERLRREEAERFAEEATRELYTTREQVRLLGRVAVAANEAASFEEAAEVAMDAIREQTGWPVAHAWVVADGTDELVPTGVWRGDREIGTLSEETATLRLGRGTGLPGRVLDTGEPTWVPDVGADPTFPRADAALASGLRTAFAFPVLSSEDDVVGVLEFFAPVALERGGAFNEVMLQVGRQLGRVVSRVRVESALRSALADLERSNHELEAFAYVASHDLREPLRSIGGFAELLARRYTGQLDDSADEFIGFILDGVGRLQTLIDDILAFSRAGRGVPRRDPVDLAEVLEAVLRSQRLRIEDTGGTVDVGPLPTVVGDARQFGQVLENLVANALKFHGDAPPRVAVAAERRGTAWLVTVTDGGIGIDPAHADRIFEMFQRLHGRGDYEGSGIGLSICRRIVEHHGGRIWVEPGPDARGSRFSILLPDREEATPA